MKVFKPLSITVKPGLITTLWGQ